MKLILTSCPVCGDVDVPEEAVTVTENKVSPEWSTYAFTCPTCNDEVVQPATFQVLSLLAMAKGVRWNVVRIPAELDEAHYLGPALTEQDVADFTIDLNLTPAHLITMFAGGYK